MRIAIPLLAIVLGLLVAVAVMRSGMAPDQPAIDPATEHVPPPLTEELAPDAEPDPATAPEPATPRDPAEPDRDPDEVDEPDEPAPALDTLQVLPAERPAAVQLGDDDPDTPARMRVNISSWGAGIRQAVLANYDRNIETDERYLIFGTVSAPNPRPGPNEPDQYTILPFAARSVVINEQRIDLQAVQWSADDPEADAAGQRVTYRLIIADADGEPVLELVRRFVLANDSYDLQFDQFAINRSDQPLDVSFEQNIQGDITADDATYLGDRRVFVAGYFDVRYDPRRNTIFTRNGFMPRHTLIGRGDIWPNPDVPQESELAWLASENRYFATITHPVVTDDMQRTGDVPALEHRFPRVGTIAVPPNTDVPDDRRAVVFTLGTDTLRLDAGEQTDLSLAVYAGPRDRRIFEERPYDLLEFNQLIRYELGCAFCTFQWLARTLLWMLEWFYWLVADWGIAIILLVLLVRLLLHPITKRAQTNMMKMGKQMQAIQPDMEKLRKKYKDNQQQLQREMMKLYREKGINPANMLGCLPMFLQMPIWIALYAMLYFAIELRHQPAFYGVFQWIGDTVGTGWLFLADLSSADHFIRFPGEGFEVTFIPFINLQFAAINILPLLMGLVFYFNMKLTAPPPPEGEMTEQQEMMVRQQKIMRIVFPFLMPVFLYSAPSGLTLYICASTFAGIIDSWIVRRHVKQLEDEGRLFEKKPVKPGGFMDRIHKVIEAKQQQMFEQQKQQTGDGGGKKKKRK
ncbi:YidC/Oxa1 family insertase periplasmic-domain containing protein [Phycisphaerales bacterium AB-hyl4]|uniref:Membrane protein insertase YidC n=1 Tax=Natronomicrosphaera hydrolytica TaxID=3242702 RepID=A0ABV4U844_9BACT